MNEGWWTDEVQDELAFVIGGAVTLDEESVRKNPMQLHDAAVAVLRRLPTLIGPMTERGDEASFADLVAALREHEGVEERWECREEDADWGFECVDKADRDERREVHGQHHDCGPVLVVPLDSGEDR